MNFQTVPKYPGNNSIVSGNTSTLAYPESSTNSEDWTCRCGYKNSVSTTCENCFKAKSETQMEPAEHTQTQSNGYATGNPLDIEPDCANDQKELRLVLIGRTGCGKSATGNTILGRKHFKAMVAGSSVTAECTRGEALRNERLLLVVDTPGLFDTNKLNFEVTREISKCIGMTSPGPHAVLLVIGIGRYTQEEQETVKHFIEHYGEDVVKHMIIVFTKEDCLKYEDKTIQEFVEGAPPNLKEMVRKCGNRYIAINNLAAETENQNKVDELIRKIDDMVARNGGKYYTNAMYEAAEEVITRRMEQIRLEFEQNQERQRSKMKRQISSVFEREISELNKEKSKLEIRLERMQWEKDYTENEKQTLQMEMEKLHHQREIGEGELDSGGKRELTERIAALRRREVELSQQLQQKERQRLMMLSDLEKTKYGIKKKTKENEGRRYNSGFNCSIDERTQRQKVRDEVENKSPNIFQELLASLKNVGRTFLSHAIKFFSKMF